MTHPDRAMTEGAVESVRSTVEYSEFMERPYIEIVATSDVQLVLSALSDAERRAEEAEESIQHAHLIRLKAERDLAEFLLALMAACAEKSAIACGSGVLKHADRCEARATSAEARLAEAVDELADAHTALDEFDVPTHDEDQFPGTSPRLSLVYRIGILGSPTSRQEGEREA